MPNPLPTGYVLLLLATPGVLLFGSWATRRASDDRTVQWITAPMVGIATWLLLVHATGRSWGSFGSGLVLGSLPLSALGWALFLRDRGRAGAGTAIPPAASEDVLASPPTLGRPGSREGRRTAVAMGVSALFAMALIAPMTLGWAFHDELPFTGHMSIVAQLQNDVYPPRHLTFPELELRYHYGYNLLVAMVTALVRLPLDRALDVVTLAMWGYTWCLLWVLGERVIGRGAGWITAVMVSFGGGLPFFAVARGSPLLFTFLGVASRDGVSLNRPTISYFFQHPWTVGLPLAVSILLLWSEPRRSRSAYWLVGWLLIALFLCQYVLFLSLLAALAVADPFRRAASRGWRPWRQLRRRWKSFVAFPALALGAFLVTRFLGGFALPPPDHLAELRLDLGVARTAAGSLLWHAETFGLLLPLGIAGLWRLGRLRVVSVFLVAGSLLIINSVRYAHSEDIAKFATVAGITLSLGSSALLWGWWTRGGGVRRWSSLALLAAASAAGLLFAAAFVFDVEGTELVVKAPVELHVEDRAVLAWLREHAGPEDVVYREPFPGLGYAQWGGVPQAWLDGMVTRHGFSPARVERRSELLTTPPHGPEPYLRQNVRWFVVGDGDGELEGIAAAWVRDGRAEVVFTTPHLRLVHLLEVEAARQSRPPS